MVLVLTLITTCCYTPNPLCPCSNPNPSFLSNPKPYSPAVTLNPSILILISSFFALTLTNSPCTLKLTTPFVSYCVLSSALYPMPYCFKLNIPLFLTQLHLDCTLPKTTYYNAFFPMWYSECDSVPVSDSRNVPLVLMWHSECVLYSATKSSKCDPTSSSVTQNISSLYYSTYILQLK